MVLTLSILGPGLLVAAPAGAQEIKADKVKDVDIKVFNDCYVKNDNGTYTSYFGYELKKPESVTLEAGTPFNFMENAPANSGQPSSFTGGIHSLVFSVTWNPDDKEPTWILNDKKVDADKSKDICKEVPAVPEFPYTLVGPVVALTAFGAWFHLRRRSPWAAAAVT